jgi:thioesterase-3
MKSKEIVIRGYHCDSYGHVNNARYLELLEEARWEALSSAIQSGFFESHGLLFIVVNINVNYRAEVKPNDVVHIDTSLKEFGKMSITFHQKIVNQNSEKLAVDADVKFVLLDQNTKRMVAIDDDLKAVFGKLNEEK